MRAAFLKAARSVYVFLFMATYDFYVVAWGKAVPLCNFKAARGAASFCAAFVCIFAVAYGNHLVALLHDVIYRRFVSAVGRGYYFAYYRLGKQMPPF